MRKLILLLLASTLALTVCGQTYEPQILILTPKEFKYEETFEKEIKSKNKALSKKLKESEKSEYLTSEEFKEQPENMQQMILSKIEFFEQLDFSSQASFIAHDYLTYRFYERFTNLLILLSNKKSDGALPDLAQIAEVDNIQYVLNFSEIALFKRDGINMAKISVQLYDNLSKDFLINTEYEGNWNNPGFYFACENGSIDCTINNALAETLENVIYQVASNSSTIKRDRELAQQRFDELVSTYYLKLNDKTFLESIIPESDSNIVLADQFQIIVDPTKTKFIAFFLKQVAAQNFKAITGNKRDENVNIISNKNLKDEDFLDNMPQTYAYIVKGVKHKEKWYYEKSNVTYFEAENLEKGRQEYFYNLSNWKFFKENSVEFNPAFWESYFFTKVERAAIKNKEEIEELKKLLSKAKDAEDKAFYQSMIEEIFEEDLKNRDYFGLYEIVVRQLKREKEKQLKQFSKQIADDVLIEFYENYCKQNELKGYVKINNKELPLIFPNDKSVILSPVVLDYGNDNKRLNFFVLIPAKDQSYRIYKWNYFKPVKPQYNAMYGQDINEQLNQITKWNFSFDSLNDEDFWENYVLKKTDKRYKYLLEIK